MNFDLCLSGRRRWIRTALWSTSIVRPANNGLLVFNCCGWLALVRAKLARSALLTLAFKWPSTSATSHRPAHRCGSHFSVLIAKKQYFDFCVNDKIAMFAICYCWRCARKTVRIDASKCVFVYFAHFYAPYTNHRPHSNENPNEDTIEMTWHNEKRMDSGESGPEAARKRGGGSRDAYSRKSVCGVVAEQHSELDKCENVSRNTYRLRCLPGDVLRTVWYGGKVDIRNGNRGWRVEK